MSQIAVAQVPAPVDKILHATALQDSRLNSARLREGRVCMGLAALLPGVGLAVVPSMCRQWALPPQLVVKRLIVLTPFSLHSRRSGLRGGWFELVVQSVLWLRHTVRRWLGSFPSARSPFVPLSFGMETCGQCSCFLTWLHPGDLSVVVGWEEQSDKQMD